MGNLIEKYDFRIAEAGCAPGSGRYGVLITLPVDISEALPYLNAVLEDTWYDHQNKVLIGRQGEIRYAFRPMEVRISGINDVSIVPESARAAVGLVNRVWHEREKIAPRYAERKMPTVVEIYNSLPRTNCKKCGYSTCLAFAADLRSKMANIEQCAPLQEPSASPKRTKILSLFSEN